MMILLCSPGSMSLAQHVRLLLDREGIPYYFSDADMSVAGIGGPMGASQSRIYIMHEEDLERALELLKEADPVKEHTVSPEKSSVKESKPYPLWMILGGSFFVVLLTAAVLAH